jgi:hypothetical protein
MNNYNQLELININQNFSRVIKIIQSLLKFSKIL